MEFELTNDKKIEALNRVKGVVTSELFDSVLLAGFDPDTFDATTWEAPETPSNGHIQRLKELSASYNLINSKLADLS